MDREEISHHLARSWALNSDVGEPPEKPGEKPDPEDLAEQQQCPNCGYVGVMPKAKKP